MQNLAAGHGSDDGNARSAAIASNDMDALESSPPTLVGAGGQQQEQAPPPPPPQRSSSIADLPESIANFQGSLTKDGGVPFFVARDIAKAASHAAPFVVGAAGASAAKSVGVLRSVRLPHMPVSSPHMPVSSVIQAAVAKPGAKPPPPHLGTAHPVSVGPPPNPGNVVAPPPEPQVKDTPHGSAAPPFKATPVPRPLQQQEGEIDLQGSLASGAQVAEPKAAVGGTLEAEVKAEGVAAPPPASVGPTQPDDSQKLTEDDVLETASAHPGHWHNEQEVRHQNDWWEGGEQQFHARQVPNAQQEAQPPREEGVNDEIGEPGHGYSQHPGNHGWNTESWQEGGNRWSERREQQDVTADDHGGRHEPQQNQTRFILMINGRKLHRPVLFS